jgi:hypothetical protein
MPLFDYRLIVDLMAPAKQVEHSGRQLQRAHELFEEHQAEMDPHDHQLAQSFLERCGDLRGGLEAKCLLTRIKQARLYCTQVDKTLQNIQAAVEINV